MSVAAFLLVVFVSLAVVGGILSSLGFRWVYLALLVGITALFVISMIATWHPSTDDPIPALMFLVIGVYGSLVGGAGMLTGLLISRFIKSRRNTT